MFPPYWGEKYSVKNTFYNRKEILRYAAVKSPSPEVLALMEECIAECEEKGYIREKVCYRILPCRIEGTQVDMTFLKVQSKGLASCLAGCGEVVCFAATIGLEIDRVIRRYGQTQLAKAAMFQAIGTERIEDLCDRFCRKIQDCPGKGEFRLTPRYSPGYGDLSLALQKDIFRVLDCEKKIGLTLNESLLMSPSKSVTAFAGICRDRVEPGNAFQGQAAKAAAKQGQETEPELRERQTHMEAEKVKDAGKDKEGHNCVSCEKTDCLFRCAPELLRDKDALK